MYADGKTICGKGMGSSVITGQKEQTEKKNTKKAVVGYDLGKIASQISFCPVGSREAVTVSCVAGTEQYNIPTVLCKREGVNQWFYGREAVKYAEEEEGILVEDLVTLAERGEEVMVGEEYFDPVSLLTLFVKRSLSLLTMHLSANRIEAVMFTVEELSPRMVDVLLRVVGGLQLKTEKVFFQSRVESFYYYTLYLPKELWRDNVLIFDYSDRMKTLCLECNRKTTPQVVFITRQQYPALGRIDFDGEEKEKEEQKKKLDESFLSVAEQALKGNPVSTVYLLGDGFKENWAKESLRLLCRNRRVFQGNNLYSRGACYGALERLAPSEEGKNHVYLGSDKLKANIGMKVLRRGEDSYFAVLDAGTNWYEASADFEVILESGNTVDFIVTSLTGENVTDKRIVLEGLPERPRGTTRLKLHVEMTAPDQVTVTIEDMGFGEIFLSSGKGWTQTISV